MSELTITRPLDPKVVYRLLADDGTFATCLQIVCLASYGPEIYQVDPLELILRLEEDFHVRVTDSNENKLKAILLATQTDIFYENPEAFRGTCETLTNGDPGIFTLDQLTVAEVFIALYEVELNHGPGEFSPQVQVIIDQVISLEADDPAEATSDDPSEYVWAYLRDQHEELKNQLISLGVDPADLPPMDIPERLESTGADPEVIADAETILSAKPTVGYQSSEIWDPKPTQVG